MLPRIPYPTSTFEPSNPLKAVFAALKPFLHAIFIPLMSSVAFRNVFGASVRGSSPKSYFIVFK